MIGSKYAVRSVLILLKINVDRKHVNVTNMKFKSVVIFLKVLLISVLKEVLESKSLKNIQFVQISFSTCNENSTKGEKLLFYII